MIIKEVEEEDLEAIALLSFKTFKGLFISDLGIGFLKHFYKAISSSKEGIIYVLKDGNEVKGFICGITENKGIFSFSFKVKFIYYLLKLLFSYKRIINLIRFVKKYICFKNIGPRAELISVVVEEDLRGKGYGKMLVERFCSFLSSKGIKRFKVVTEVRPASFFYEKLNFTLIKAIDLFGRECRCYEKVI